MKVTQILFMAAILSIVLAFSCNHSKLKKAAFVVDNGPELIQQFNLGKFPYQQGKYLVGQVYLRYADGNSLLAFVNDEDPASNPVVFGLQTNEKIPTDYEYKIEHAEVFYTQKNLVINDRNNRDAIFMGIAPEEDIVNIKQYTMTTLGFGLASFELGKNESDGIERNSDFGAPGDFPPVEGCICLYVTAMSDDCNSGGMGATGCGGNYGPNGQPCQVNCSVADNYHACCNPE